MKIYKTNQGVLIENDNKFYLTDKEWDSFIVNDDIYDNTLSLISGLDPIENSAAVLKNPRMPGEAIFTIVFIMRKGQNCFLKVRLVGQ